MDHRKIPNLALAIVVIASLLVAAGGATSAAVPAPDVAVSAIEREVTLQSEITAAAAPTSPTDESQVPHYFGPNPNWALSPFTVPDVTVTITGDGNGATAAATVGANGVVTGLTLTSPGSGYTAATVSINNAAGTNPSAAATATVAMSGAVTGVTVTAGGAGYTSPTVSFTGGGGTGTLVQVGNPLIDRTYATDAPPEPMPRPVFVVIPTPLPAGTLTDFLSWNQAVPVGNPPSAGETFFAYVLRPTGTPNQYSVVFASPLQTVPALADSAISQLATYNVGSVAVLAGDVIAFYGAGIPLDLGSATPDLASYPAPTAPSLPGEIVTLGGAGFPLLGDARTYSFAANVVDTSGVTPLTNATATAYGSVEKAAFEASLVAGSGYTMPTIDFDMPDDPNGVQARAHVAQPLGANGEILTIVLDEPGSGYAKAPNVVIRDGTLQDPIIGGSGASAAATLAITSITVDTPGDGYVSAPTVTISDPTGTLAAATATVSAGSIAAINLTTGGTGYITGGGIKKFVDPLPGLCNPAVAGSCPDWAANPAAKAIPLAVAAADKVYNGIAADEYEIGLVQYRTNFSSSLPPTLARGYVQIAGPKPAVGNCADGTFELFNSTVDPLGTPVPTGYCGVTPPQWLGPVIAATKDKPVRIIFRNLLPTGSDGDLFLPTDSTLMGSGMADILMYDPLDSSDVTDEARNPQCTQYPKPDACFKDNRATLHLHGGTSPWISDGTPHQWITPANQTTKWPQGVSVSNVPDMAAAGCDGTTDGCMTFYYTNQQSARLLFYHDHAWGITRLNVYAGEAAGYLISDDTEKALLASNTIPADQIPLVIQDRTFVPQDTQMYNVDNTGKLPWDAGYDAAHIASYGLDPTWDKTRWGGYGNFWYHHVYMPAQNPGDPGGMSAYGRWMYGPWFWPPAAATKFGPIPNPYFAKDALGNPTCHLDDPATWQYQTDPFCEPALIPGTPNISTGMEQFNDTPIVNGVAYPTVTLQPKTYRFRVLSAANDRFFNFQWYVGDPTTASTDLNKVPAPVGPQVIGPTEVALNPLELAAAQTDPVVFPTPVQPAPTELCKPDWIQIGTEGGFLPAPVVVDGQQPTTWITDPTRFDVGNVDLHSLLLAPAERADVIVDFSKCAGKTLILYNDAPAAFPARVPSYDYYTGAPDLSPNGAPAILPGYGPNTRTVMQVKIAAATPAPAFNLTALRNAFSHKANGTGVFESGQHPIIVGQAAYNSAYGTSFAAGSNCNVPINSTTTSISRCDGLVRVDDTSIFGFNTLKAPATRMTMGLQPKAIHDEMNSTTFDEYGRMQANLGIEAQPPTPAAQNVTLYPYVNPQTELIDATNLPKNDVQWSTTDGLPVSDVKIAPISSATDGSQIWRITHNGVDTHPIHFHLYDVQVLNRVTWDNIIIPTEATELGWKDTIRVSPLEDTIVALRPIIPELPWELPNAIRNLSPMMSTGSTQFFNNIDPQGNPTAPIVNQLVNFGWEYVYHCHILSHEEMDMMRPVSVAMPPVKPDTLQWSVTGTGNNTRLTLTWNDKSIADTAYTVQRMNGTGAWADIGTIQVPLDPIPATPNIVEPNTTGPMSFTDTTFRWNNSVYSYRVVAKNTVGYLDGAGPGGFADVTAQSMSEPVVVIAAPTNLVATLLAGPTRVSLSWTDNTTNETHFNVERSTDGVNFTVIGAAPVRNNTGTQTFVDTTVTQGTTYWYRVAAMNGLKASAYSTPITIIVDVPAAPTGLVGTAVRQGGGGNERVTLTWNDVAGETGYTIQWSANNFSTVSGSGAVGANVMTFTTGNIVRQAWQFRVRAVNALGVSLWSATLNVPAAP